MTITQVVIPQHPINSWRQEDRKRRKLRASSTNQVDGHQAFPMKQGVQLRGVLDFCSTEVHLVSLVLEGEMVEHRRKSLRGCIVSQDLSVINLVIVKKGDNDLPGLTDIENPRMRGLQRSGSSSNFPRTMMSASMSTPIVASSPTRRARRQARYP